MLRHLHAPCFTHLRFVFISIYIYCVGDEFFFVWNQFFFSNESCNLLTTVNFGFFHVSGIFFTYSHSLFLCYSRKNFIQKFLVLLFLLSKNETKHRNSFQTSKNWKKYNFCVLLIPSKKKNPIKLLFDKKISIKSAVFSRSKKKSLKCFTNIKLEQSVKRFANSRKITHAVRIINTQYQYSLRYNW